MAVSVNTEELPEKGGSSNPETMFIPAGNQLARFVSYVELGVHYQKFKGAKAKYEQGKNAGREKPPVLHVALQFEFPAAEYTGDYPLTISTTRQMDNGDFFDSVVVPASLADGTISKAYAMKTKFMKFLSALQNASEKHYTSIAAYANAGVPLLINVTNKDVVKEGETKTYANMKPEGILAPEMKHPVSGKVEMFEVPEIVGDYCPVFDWEEPTALAWMGLPPWHKKTIKAAINFGGSPIDMLLQATPELDKAIDGEGAAEDHKAPQEPGSSDNPNPPPQSDMPV